MADSDSSFDDYDSYDTARNSMEHKEYNDDFERPENGSDNSGPDGSELDAHRYYFNHHISPTEFIQKRDDFYASKKEPILIDLTDSPNGHSLNGDNPNEVNPNSIIEDNPNVTILQITPL